MEVKDRKGKLMWLRGEREEREKVIKEELDVVD